MVDTTNPVFYDEKKAMPHLEALRWPGGAFCPHCGSTNVHRMAGKTQTGMFLCNDCRAKFTARVGSVMARSHIPVHKWLLAMHLMAESKEKISSRQLQHALGVSYKSAWFLSKRIRSVMRAEGIVLDSKSARILLGNITASQPSTIGRLPSPPRRNGRTERGIGAHPQGRGMQALRGARRADEIEWRITPLGKDLSERDLLADKRGAKRQRIPRGTRGKGR
jgi:transposase-like protein